MEYGLIGEKLGHSFSKIIHSELCDYEYELKEIPKDKLDEFMKKAEFKAINVTIPYKQDVIPYLDEISDTAKSIGAVNTIVNQNGKLYGYNTDFYGARELILKNKIELKDKKVLVLGSGGTSKTMYAVSDSLGASEIYRVSRSGKNGSITYENAYQNHSDCDVIINTTPCGMYPNLFTTAIDIDKFSNLSGVVDAVYNPLSSAIVTKAHEKGISAAGGLYMLVAQAVFAAEKFTGTKIERSRLDEVYHKIYSEKRNLVLIGMPGCGKSTIGKAIAKELGKQFIDTDEEVIKVIKMPISDYFNKYGEAEFRKIESEVIKNVSALQNCVIATGGGAVLNHDNISYLRENGMILFLDRPIDNIVATDDRPLSSNRETLQKRYDERYDIYCSSADIKVDVKDNLESNVKTVKEVFTNEDSCN